MHEQTLTVVITIAASLALWSLVSSRLERWNISAPIVFVAVGMAATQTGVIDLSIGSTAVRQIAELTLAVVLFADASGVQLAKLRRDAVVPTRLLGIGLPLTIALGTVVAHLVLPGLSWWVCAVIGAAVAPTDAALGAAIIEDERVPAKIRRVLNVESGLNDGIATPFVNFFLAAAVVGTAYETSSEIRPVLELGIGVVAGIAIGAVGGWAMVQSARRNLSTASSRALGTAALSLVAYAGVVQIGGNGFVAAFVAGIAYGRATQVADDEPELAFTRELDEVLSLVVWFIFGALSLSALRHATWQDVAFAVLALTVVRMAPVAISLVRSGFDRSTIVVMGWFGPRGLATVVFGLLALDTLAPSDGERVLTVIATTVLLSVVLHGASAAPVAKRYGASHPATDEPQSVS